MDFRKCTATTKTGAPCRARALPNADFCMAHHPDLAETRAEARRRGGRNVRAEARIYKRMPSGIKETLEALYQALEGVQNGSLTPGQGQAIASLSRAIVVLYEAGQVDARIDALEAKVCGQDL